MKTVLVIGLGRFGKHLINKFNELDDEVMAVDIDEKKIQEIIPFVTSAQIGDCTKEETLKSLGVKNFDLCFVCVGDDFQSSLEITNLLYELGAEHIIGKASTTIHAKFLLKSGAHEVVYPERDSAEKLATRYSVANVFDYIELSEDVSIYEIPVIDHWLGKSISKLEVRRKYKINIVATKKDGEVNPLPSADYIFADENEHIIVLGRHVDVEKILKHLR